MFQWFAGHALFSRRYSFETFSTDAWQTEIHRPFRLGFIDRVTRWLNDEQIRFEFTGC